MKEGSNQKIKLENIGVWAFYAGLILTIVIAVFQTPAPSFYAVLTIAILGIIVGILNITTKEVKAFLLAAVAFLLSVSALSTFAEVFWEGAGIFFTLLTIFIAPSTAITALKEIYSITKQK